MSDPTKEKINFYREVQNILFQIMDLTVPQEAEIRVKFTNLSKSIAERVEEQTIQRCHEEYGNGRNMVNGIKRIYAQQSEPEK